MSDHDPNYWPKLLGLLRGMSIGPRVFVDVGANRGEFSAQLLQEFPGCSIHAVEPDPALCEELARRFAGKPVTLWRAALGHAQGHADLLVHANPGTSSLLPRPSGTRRYFDSGDRVVAVEKVRTTSLDQLARDAGLSRIHLLKLDTQGSELAIIRGAGRLLESAAIDVIYTEFFVVPHYDGAALLHELWAALARHGYVLYDLFKGPYGRNGQLRFGDAIFVSPNVRRDYLDAFPEES